MIALKSVYHTAKEQPAPIQYDCVNCGAPMPQVNGAVKCRHCNAELVIFEPTYPYYREALFFDSLEDEALRSGLVEWHRLALYTRVDIVNLMNRWKRADICACIADWIPEDEEWCSFGILMVEGAERALKAHYRIVGVEVNPPDGFKTYGDYARAVLEDVVTKWSHLCRRKSDDALSSPKKETYLKAMARQLPAKPE